MSVKGTAKLGDVKIKCRGPRELWASTSVETTGKRRLRRSTAANFECGFRWKKGLDELAFDREFPKGIEHFAEGAIGLQDSQIVVERGHAAGNRFQHGFQFLRRRSSMAALVSESL